MLNRQFAAQRLEEMLKTDFRDFGYRHYQYKSERKDPIDAIRQQFLSE